MADTPNPPIPPLLEVLASSSGRAILQAVAGVLVAKGLLGTDNSAQFVNIGLGILVSAAGLLWSYIHNKVAQRTLVAAVNAPAAVPPVPVPAGGLKTEPAAPAPVAVLPAVPEAPDAAGEPLP